MTVFDKIKEYNEKDMVEFLYRFARDTLDQFARFIIPSKEGVKEFLDRECPTEREKTE